VGLRFRATEHRIIRSHPVLTALRKNARRGPEVVIFQHKHTRNFILAETDGRTMREIATLHGWPHLRQDRMRELIKQLRPMRGVHKAKQRILMNYVDARREKYRNIGRETRVMNRRFRDCLPKAQQDHPAYNWSEIKGEGI
jgi:hypothetical protein